MSAIGFISLLQEYPMVGFGLALVFFALMFGIKNVIVLLYSRSFEKNKSRDM